MEFALKNCYIYKILIKLIISTIELKTLIKNFKKKVKENHPDVLAKAIYLTTRQHPFMLEEVMGAVRSFEQSDFVKRPIVEFVAE